MKKILNYILIAITIFVILMFLLTNFNKFQFFHNNILFLRYFDSAFNNGTNNKEKISIATKNNSQTKNTYYLNVEYKNTNFANINLKDTIKTETLVEEKIAPGIEGNFDILLYSNYNVKYSIKFQNKSNKPQNLKFNIEGTNIQESNLENLSTNLSGTLLKNQNKKITINWKWEYENGESGNIKDTEDAILIDKYYFDILALGEEII